MSLVEHAQRELDLVGLTAPDSDYDGMLGEAVLELIEVFANQGHSGTSAAITLALFNRVANFQNLSDLTNSPDEWNHIANDIAGIPNLWQSSRRSDAFSNDGGKTYYLLDEEPRVIHESVSV